MKYLIYLVCLWSCFSFSTELDSQSYMGISLGEQDSKSIYAFNGLFGEMEEGYALYCLKNDETFLVFTVSNDTHHHFSRTEYVELSLYSPDVECQESKTEVKEFNGVRPGMYQSEIVSILRKNGYRKGYATSKQVTYEKSIKETAQCHHYEESEYDPEYYAYGSKKVTLSYSLSRFKVGKAMSIKKSLTYGFVPIENKECSARNKSKHSDLVKLSPFLFKKSRQLHQAGV